MRQSPSQRVREWNASHPVGQIVTFLDDKDQAFTVRTRSEAWLLRGRIPVVRIEGRRGCFSLCRMTPKPLVEARP